MARSRVPRPHGRPKDRDRQRAFNVTVRCTIFEGVPYTLAGAKRVFSAGIAVPYTRENVLEILVKTWNLSVFREALWWAAATPNQASQRSPVAAGFAFRFRRSQPIRPMGTNRSQTEMGVAEYRSAHNPAVTAKATGTSGARTKSRQGG